MPTYEYACPTCGIVEVFQSIKEDALKKCPQCKRAKVQRVLSGGGGVIFKGSGFWETDYNRSADYKKKTKESEKSDDTATPVAAPPESKPAPATKLEPKTTTTPTAKPKPTAVAT